MTVINQANAGLAFSADDTFNLVTLHTGPMPQMTTPEIVAAATISGGDLPAYSVVGRNAQGELVLATVDTVTPANSIKPVGITTVAVKQGATGRNVPMWRDGMFNPDALNWHSSYTTDLLKKIAFEGSQASIYLRKPTFTA